MTDDNVTLAGWGTNDSCMWCRYYSTITNSNTLYADCTNPKSLTFQKLKCCTIENRRDVMWSHKKICDRFEPRSEVKDD